MHNVNGWNRDTAYGRTVTARPNNGGYLDGDWHLKSDNLDVVPAGGNGQPQGQRPLSP
jgi:hypothetical protein